MSDLTFAELSAGNRQRAERWHPGFPEDDDWSGADWSNAMCGEAGEYANIIKKIRRHETGAANEGDPPVEELKRKAARELADVVIYADLNASYLGIDLGEAIREKFNQKSVEYGFPERL